MSIISEVKCARCDRKYSGVRSRCPYCGARRIGQGKYSDEEDNSKGKMLIGILIMAVLVVAAGVLLFSTPAPDDGKTGDISETPPTSQMPNDGDNTITKGDPITPPTLPSTEPPVSTPPEPDTPKARSVVITYNNRENNDFTVKIAEKVPLRARIDPVGVEEEIIWESDNLAVFEVIPSADGTQATVIGVGVGTAHLKVYVGGVEDECVVRGIKG